MDSPHDHILNKQEVVKMTGLSLRTVERLRDLRPIRISAGRVGYRASDVAEWIASRPAAAA